jgi:hypothetical protein
LCVERNKKEAILLEVKRLQNVKAYAVALEAVLKSVKALTIKSER